MSGNGRYSSDRNQELPFNLQLRLASQRRLQLHCGVWGCGYPLYYDTFFHDLRDFCRGEVETARAAGLGVWSADASTSGFAWSNDLKNLPPIFPKLWRRIQKYIGSETFFDEDDPAANLVPYIKSRRDERVLTLGDSRLTGFDNLVDTNGDQVKLLADPNEMVVISEK